MKLLLLSLFLFTGINEKIITVNQDTGPVKIAPYLEYYEDRSNADFTGITGDNIHWQ